MARKGKIEIGASVTVGAKEDGSLSQIEKRIEKLSNEEIEINIKGATKRLQELDKMEQKLGKNMASSIEATRKQLTDLITECKQEQKLRADNLKQIEQEVKAAKELQKIEEKTAKTQKQKNNGPTKREQELADITKSVKGIRGVVNTFDDSKIQRTEEKVRKLIDALDEYQTKLDAMKRLRKGNERTMYDTAQSEIADLKRALGAIQAVKDQTPSIKPKIEKKEKEVEQEKPKKTVTQQPDAPVVGAGDSAKSIQDQTAAIKQQAGAMESLEKSAEKAAKQVGSIFDPVKQKKYTDYINGQIKDTERSIQNQQDWIRHLGWVFDDGRFASSGKKDAYDKLKLAAMRYNDASRRKTAGTSISEDEIELATIAWKKAYDEAVKQGVAERRLYDYKPPVWNYDSSLQRVQGDYDYRKKTLERDEVQLTSLKQIQENIEGFAQLCDVLGEYRQCIKDINGDDKALAESAAQKLDSVKKNLSTGIDIKDLDKQNALLDIKKKLRADGYSIEQIATDYISRIGFLDVEINKAKQTIAAQEEETVATARNNNLEHYNQLIQECTQLTGELSDAVAKHARVQREMINILQSGSIIPQELKDAREQIEEVISGYFKKDFFEPTLSTDGILMWLQSTEAAAISIDRLVESVEVKYKHMLTTQSELDNTPKINSETTAIQSNTQAVEENIKAKQKASGQKLRGLSEGDKEVLIKLFNDKSFQERQGKEFDPIEELSLRTSMATFKRLRPRVKDIMNNAVSQLGLEDFNDIVRHYLNDEILANSGTLLFTLFEDYFKQGFKQFSLSDFMKDNNIVPELRNDIIKMLNGLSINYSDFINYAGTLDLETINLRIPEIETQQLFETPSGQISMFEGMADPVFETVEATNELAGALKSVEQIAGQISFDEYVKDIKDIVYHAGDLSNIDKTIKSLTLGHVKPQLSGGVYQGKYRPGSIFNGLTGLYTTEDLDSFIGNEWTGAPISSIDISKYKLFKPGSNEIATRVMDFFDELNGTIYGYLEYFDMDQPEMQVRTDVKPIEELYSEMQAIFGQVNVTVEEFTKWVNDSKAAIKGYKFVGREQPVLDEGISKVGYGTVLDGAPESLINADSFQTQLMKMLGFEGIDLRGTKYNGTYTGGTVIFDIKPESLKAINEKYSDVMVRNGLYSAEEAKELVEFEEKRRQLAFETAKAYSKQALIQPTVQSNAVEAAIEESIGGAPIEVPVVPVVEQTEEAIKSRIANLVSQANQIPQAENTTRFVHLAGADNNQSIFENGLNLVNQRLNTTTLSLKEYEDALNGVGETYGSVMGVMQQYGGSENAILLDIPVDSIIAYTATTGDLEIVSRSFVKAAIDTKSGLYELNAAYDASHDVVNDYVDVIREAQAAEENMTSKRPGIKRSESLEAVRAQILENRKLIRKEIEDAQKQKSTLTQVSNDIINQLTKGVNIEQILTKYGISEDKLDRGIDLFKDFAGALYQGNGGGTEASEIFNTLFEYISENAQRTVETQKYLEAFYDRMKLVQVRIPENMEETFAAEFTDEWKNIKKRFAIGGNYKNKKRLLTTSKYASTPDVLVRDLIEEGFGYALGIDKNYNGSAQNSLRLILDAVQNAKDEAKLGKTQKIIGLNDEDQLELSKDLVLAVNTMSNNYQALSAASSEVNTNNNAVTKSAAQTGDALESQANSAERAAKAMEDLQGQEQTDEKSVFPAEKVETEIDRIRNAIHSSEIGLDQIANTEGLQAAVAAYVKSYDEIDDKKFKLISADINEVAEGVDRAALKFQSLEDENVKLAQTWVMNDGELTLGKLRTTKTFVDSESNFDTELERTVANSKIDALESQLIGIDHVSQKVTDSLTSLRAAAGDISSDSDIKTFAKNFQVAQNYIKEFKNEYKTLGSLANETQNAQAKMANAQETINAQISSSAKYIGVDGYDKVTQSIGNMTSALSKYNEAQKKISDGGLDAEAISKYEKQMADAFTEYNKAEKQLGASMKEVRANASFDTFSKSMKDAETVIDITKLKLDKFGDLDGVDKANGYIEDMTAAWKKFNDTDSTIEDKAQAVKDFTSANESFTKQVQYLNEVQKQTPKEPPINKIQTYYERYVNAVKTLNDVNQQLYTYQGKNESGAYNGLIEQLQEQKTRILAELQDINSSVQEEVLNIYDPISLDGDKYKFDLSRYLDTDTASTIKEFFNNASVEAELGAESIQKFIDVAMKSSKIDAAFAEGIGKQLKSINDLHESTKEFASAGAEQLFKSIQAGFAEKLTSGTDWTQEQENRLRSLIETYTEYANVIDKAAQKERKILNSVDGKNVLKGDKLDPTKDMYDQMAEQAEKMRQATGAAAVSIDGFDEATGRLIFTLDGADGKARTFTMSMTELGHVAVAQVKNIDKVKTGWDEFKSGLGGVGKQILQYGLRMVEIYDIVRYLRQGFNEVLQIDTAMTELKKVTDETTVAYDNFAKSAYASSKKIGSTMKEFIQATADFARLGYSIDEASQLAEAANVYKNVGDGIDDVAQASESIISTMKAFNIEAADSMGIVDRFNEIGNNFAIDSVGIGEALQRSASALAEAGNSIDESIALVTAAMKIGCLYRNV